MNSKFVTIEKNNLSSIDSESSQRSHSPASIFVRLPWE
jgi:hypothetical protein